MGRPYLGGHLTAKGYRRTWVIGTGKMRMVHDLVWEKHHGPIPENHDIHHIDGDKQNNTIENLQLVDKLTHKRIHGGCQLRGGEWWKPCTHCAKMKKVATDFYGRPDGSISSACKKCMISMAIVNKQKRRLKKLN